MKAISRVLFVTALLCLFGRPAFCRDFTEVSDWVNTQFSGSIEMRKPLGGLYTGTANLVHFVTPQSHGEMNFFYLGIEHQTIPDLWISPQLGMVTGWAEDECPVVGFWAGWDFQKGWELSTDTEIILGGGLSDYFGHYELNRRVAFGKVGIQLEQVNASQQTGVHLQVKKNGLKLNLGLYGGSGTANARVGIAYTADL